MITITQNPFASALCLAHNASYSHSPKDLISRLINFTRGGGSCQFFDSKKTSEHPPIPFSTVALDKCGIQLVSSRCI
jgi:hypothetical protein